MSIQSAEIPPLTHVQLKDRELPGLHLSTANMFVAFGDGDAGQGDVPTRLEKGSRYLTAVVRGLNSPEGERFVKEALEEEEASSHYDLGAALFGAPCNVEQNPTLRYFPYDPENPRFLAPCQVTKNAEGHMTVVVFSYGPK